MCNNYISAVEKVNYVITQKINFTEAIFKNRVTPVTLQQLMLKLSHIIFSTRVGYF